MRRTICLLRSASTAFNNAETLRASAFVELWRPIACFIIECLNRSEAVIVGDQSASKAVGKEYTRKVRGRLGRCTDKPLAELVDDDAPPDLFPVFADRALVM